MFSLWGDIVSTGNQFFEGLQQMESDSLQKILISMMSPENIKMKSEVSLTMPMAQLLTLAAVLKSEGVPDLPKIITDFVDEYLTLQVSHDRGGRKEVFGTLSEGLKEERRLRDKLTSPNSEV